MNGSPAPDLAEVAGLDDAKRALEVALAGGHPLLLLGPAGAGKTLLLHCLPTLLPPRPDGTPPPIRRPHPESTPAGMLGSRRTPGEIERAHQGVLALDDLAAFKRPTLRALGPPLAEGTVRVARRGGERQADAAFLLIATLRSCPCGAQGARAAPCGCSPRRVEGHLRRAWEVLGPSFQLVMPLQPARAIRFHQPEEQGSAAVRARIAAARRVQAARFGAEKANPTNGAMSSGDLARHCALDPAGKALSTAAREKLGLSAGSLASALRVARTIADLAGREDINAAHLAEAVGYRSNPLEDGASPTPPAGTSPARR